MDVLPPSARCYGSQLALAVVRAVHHCVGGRRVFLELAKMGTNVPREAHVLDSMSPGQDVLNGVASVTSLQTVV